MLVSSAAEFSKQKGLSSLQVIGRTMAEKLASEVWPHRKSRCDCLASERLLHTLEYYLSIDSELGTDTYRIEKGNDDIENYSLRIYAFQGRVARAYRIWRTGKDNFLLKAAHEDIVGQ